MVRKIQNQRDRTNFQNYFLWGWGSGIFMDGNTAIGNCLPSILLLKYLSKNYRVLQDNGLQEEKKLKIGITNKPTTPVDVMQAQV